MAAALLPFLLLAAVQAQADFRAQADVRRQALQGAAQRSALAAQARLDAAAVLLQALWPESRGPGCANRLAAMAGRIEGRETLVRYDADGAVACASMPDDDAGGWTIEAGRGDWMRRLSEGERRAAGRAPSGAPGGPALIVALRVDGPDGDWDGALATTLPLDSLTPDPREPGLPPGAQAALVDGQGRILATTDAAVFALRRPERAPDWISEARTGAAPVFAAVDAAGERRAYAGTALADQDVYVLISAPAPGPWSWARLNPISVFLMPLATWLAVFLAVMLVSERLVVRWLVYLQRIAALYARGRFSVRPLQATHAPTELSDLARILDDMAEAIVLRDRSLTDSLAQKDALMREVHHRVKNNLQIISSLVSLQQRALKDEAARSALGETRQRIAALALIHRVIYQGGDVRGVEARDFLNGLVGQLTAGETAFGPPVLATVEADALTIDAERLTPMALWLVEAVSNAQKHAFAGRGGVLHVRFRVEGATSVLEVEDDGPGLAPRARAGAGRTLMNAFARQLRGENRIVARAGGGVLARLTFATPQA